MRKVLFALLLTAVGLGLLLSFKSRGAGAATSALGGTALSGSGKNQTSTTAPSTSPTPSTSASPGKSSSSGSSGSSNSSGSSSKNGTFTGAEEDTRYGYVQVQATLSNGKLTDVTVLQVPDNGGYEDQIVQIALPQLKSEALSAQNANIDIVSGATYTSQGYAQSLQSALQKAGM